MKWLSQELREDSIRVNAICPGLTLTSMTEYLDKKLKISESRPYDIASPDQIASVAATIASEDGKFMNGENYVVHGGHQRL